MSRIYEINCKRTCYDIYAKTARFTKLNYGQGGTIHE